MAIEDIPDFPALRQLAASLWRDGQERGAAVLVGAGFSRNADPAGKDTPKLPLWSDLQDAMAKRLYGADSRSAPSDPLRLAEEFSVYLGPPALTEFLHQQVPDKAWTPGKLHADLMALPWSEILTTNYDTLLERTPPGCRTVRDPSDLSRVYRPRVVKLHGSIDGAHQLIISEEDYRTYPEKSAAFVNLARQVFLENELCLVGFSGDDPNFLQWSGWVRDHLGKAAGRIYLVGALSLGPAKRRLLESRNVSPIDLSSLTSPRPRDIAERMAMGLFFDFLNKARPGRREDWEPAKNSEYSFIPNDYRERQGLTSDPVRTAEVYRRLTATWKRDRETCPDWLVLPEAQRSKINRATSLGFWLTWNAVDALDEQTKTQYLREIAWRYSAGFLRLEEPLAQRLEALLLPTLAANLCNESGIEIAVCLLREARLSSDWNSFERVEGALLTLAPTGSDAAAELAWQKLLRARDGWDFHTLAKDIYALAGPDPMWRLRQAALFAELGKLDEASSSLASAVAELDQRQVHDPRSFWVLTRRAWGTVLSQALQISKQGRWYPLAPLDDALDAGYDVEGELNAVRDEIRMHRFKNANKPPDYEPTFLPGGYRDNTKTIIMEGFGRTNPYDELCLLTDIAGLPTRLPQFDLVKRDLKEAVELLFKASPSWYLSFIYNLDANDPTLERYLGRDSLACLPVEVAASLIEKFTAAREFWQPLALNDSNTTWRYAEANLGILTEALSRLIVRGDERTAQTEFERGLRFGENLTARHYLLFKPLDNLLTRSLAVLPLQKRSSLSLACLEFPLPSHKVPVSRDWPNPAEDLGDGNINPARDWTNTQWNVIICKLITAVGGDGPARDHAVARLAYLHHYNNLSSDEAASFGQVLWSETDVERAGLPTGVSLYPHDIAALPAPKGVDSTAIARNALFGKRLHDSGMETVRSLHFMTLAALAPSSAQIIPSREQALLMLATLTPLATAAAGKSQDLFSYRQDVREAAGQALAVSILPSLSSHDITDDVVETIKIASGRDVQGAGLQGLIHIARARPDEIPNVVSILRRAMARGSHNEAARACRAIAAWPNSGVAYPSQQPLPRLLVSAVVDSVASGQLIGLQAKLWCARQLLEADVLSSDDITSLTESLGYLLVDLSYGYQHESSPSVIGLSVARAECVRLALALRSRGGNAVSLNEWNLVATDDPLPEVRAAAT